MRCEKKKHKKKRGGKATTAPKSRYKHTNMRSKKRGCSQMCETVFFASPFVFFTFFDSCLQFGHNERLYWRGGRRFFVILVDWGCEKNKENVEIKSLLNETKCRVILRISSIMICTVFRLWSSYFLIDAFMIRDPILHWEAKAGKTSFPSFSFLQCVIHSG